MIRVTDLALPLDHDPEELEAALRRKLGIGAGELVRFSIARRGNDARKKAAILLVYSLDAVVTDEAAVLARHAGDPHVRPSPDTAYRFPVMAPEGWSGPRPVVIGAGPCGLLAALILAQMGFRPIVIERGKAVRERTKDTWGLWRRSVLEPESNVQFGEGGAGTFSDGKLYSRIKDPRHLSRKVLTEFVKAGAPEDILTEAHPHIGTFRLVTMVMSIRETIEKLGGEYRFGTRVEDFEVEGGQLRGLHLSTGEFLPAEHVILAVGHSARDTFEKLHQRGIHVEAKPFAIGVRIEHPQSWITRPAMGRTRATGSLARRPTAWRTRHRTGDRSIRSACARAGAWWRRPARKGGSSPTG